MSSGFNSDKVLQQFFLDIIKKLPVSSFIETGTYLGHTTYFVANSNPSFPIYTCEVNKTYHDKSVKVLGQFKNVTIYNESSEKIIARLISQQVLGPLPLFFLDAHWYNYWPLVDEMVEISKLDRSIVMIHDFKVPGKPEFHFDIGGGGSQKFSGKTIKDRRPCDINLIQDHVSDECIIGYPNYDKEAKRRAGKLVGYCIILKGLSPSEITIIQKNKQYAWGKK